MRISNSIPFAVSRVALSVALAAGVAFAASDVDAQSRGGGKVSVGSGSGHGGWQGGSGGRGGGHGSWSGGRGSWDGNRGSWHGNRGSWHGNQGHWRGGHGRYWHGGSGWYGGRYYYPGWAIGLGVGIGLTYPWWGLGYGYPYSYYPSTVVYERAYGAPVGVVVERDPVYWQSAPAYRWYCSSPAGYHPEVRECSTGWLKVLPQDGGPSTPPAAPPPSTVPRSSAPADDAQPAWRVVPGTMGSASSPGRIAAPRMGPPAHVARGYAAQDALAQNASQ